MPFTIFDFRAKRTQNFTYFLFNNFTIIKTVAIYIYFFVYEGRIEIRKWHKAKHLFALLKILSKINTRHLQLVYWKSRYSRN